MSTSTPIPIITVGQHAQIATYIINGLKPEYEGVFTSLPELLLRYFLIGPVIHTIISLGQGIAELPLLVNGQGQDLAKSKIENLGSGNYARKAVASMFTS